MKLGNPKHDGKVGYWTREQVVAMDHRATARMALKHPWLITPEFKAQLELSFLRRYGRGERPEFIEPEPGETLKELLEAAPRIIGDGEIVPRWRDAERAKQIKRQVCIDHSLSLIAVEAASNHRAVVWARREIMYHVAQATRLSLPDIGRLLNKDHTTVMLGIRAYAAKEGLPLPRGMVAKKQPNGQRRKEWTEDELEEVRRMVCERRTVREMGKRMMVSHQAICRLLKREGIFLRNAGYPGLRIAAGS